MLITVKVAATDSAVTAHSVVITVTLMFRSLSQHCHYHCCHNAVLVFAATALCSFSLSQRCAHRCLTAVGFLLCNIFLQRLLLKLLLLNNLLMTPFQSVNLVSLEVLEQLRDRHVICAIFAVVKASNQFKVAITVITLVQSTE